MNTGILSNRIAPANRWFLALAMLAVLPFLLSAGYSLVQLSQDKQDGVAQQLAIKANSAAQVVKERLTTNVAALNALASSDAAVHDDLPALYLQAQRVMQRMPENNAIALTSPTGLIFSQRYSLLVVQPSHRAHRRFGSGFLMVGSRWPPNPLRTR